MPKTARTPAQRAQDALQSLPSSIRVGAFDFALIKWDAVEAGEECVHADFSSILQTIRISDGIKSPHKIADSLVHELNHAVWFATDMNREENEEAVCSRFAKTWIAVYRDNPWLLDWLKEHTK